MADIQDTDLFLVNRNSTSYQVPSSDLMAELLDDDLMLVNRSGTSYKATGAEIKDSLGPKGTVDTPSIIAPADNAGEIVQAVSDEIIDVNTFVGPTYSTDVTASAGYTTDRGADKGFDGKTPATGGATYCQAGGFNEWVEWDASSQNINTATTSVLIWCISNTDNITATGSTGSQAIDATNNSTGNAIPNVGILQTIRVQNPVGLGGFSGISVNGDLLVDSTVLTELTFSGDKDLTVFKALDDVQQDSGYTPETSAIFDIGEGGEIEYYKWNTQPGKQSPDNLADLLANGTLVTPNGDFVEGFGEYDNFVIRYVGAKGKVGAACWKANAYLGTPAFSIIQKKEDGTLIGSQGGSYTAGEYANFNWSDSGTAFYTLDVNAAYAVVTNRDLAANVNFPALDDANLELSTLLTLTDDTDLENFRVGDKVASPAAIARIVVTDIIGNVLNAQLAADTILRVPENSVYNITEVIEKFEILDPGIVKLTASLSGASTCTYEITELVGGTTTTPTTGTITGGIPHAFDLNFTSKGHVTIKYTYSTSILDGSHILHYANTPNQNTINGVDMLFAGAGQNVFVQVGGTSSGPEATVLAVGPGNTLTFDKGGWSKGNTVTGPTTTPATGTVASTDPAANTMTLSVSDETFPKRWIANQGKFVKGEETLSQDAAPDADGLTIQSSDFASTPPGSLGHTTSDWQITLKDDIAYTNVIDSATDDGTNLTIWEPTGLEEDTAYRCRVRHSSNNIMSEWSEDSTFKTEKGGVPTAAPGVLKGVYTNGSIYQYTSAVNVLNFASSKSKVWGVGVDGNIYEGTANVFADSTLQPMSGSVVAETSDKNNKAIVTEYDFANGSSGMCILLRSDNTAVFCRRGASQTIASGSDGKEFKSIFLMSPGSNVIGGITVDGEIWLTSASTKTVAGQSILGETATKLNFVHPSGKKPVAAASWGADGANYSPVILDEDGDLWVCGGSTDPANIIGGIPTTGTLAAPVQLQPGKKFKALTGMRNNTVRSERCLCAIETNGNIWYGRTSEDYIVATPSPQDFMDTGQTADYVWWASSDTSPFLRVKGGALEAAYTDSDYTFVPVAGAKTLGNPGAGIFTVQASTSLSYFVEPN